MAAASVSSITRPSSKEIPVESVDRAVKALLKWKAAKSQDQKAQLLPSDEFLYLVITLKKIPEGRTNPYKIPLAHPLYSPSGDEELCLIIDDRPGRKPTSKDAKEKIAAEGIPISKVIKFTKLKKDYKPFEAKRKLCGSYDLFLTDRRIVPLLPKALGKHFFKKKKIPVAVDLAHLNWKEQVERICGSALMFLKTGTCSVVKVAKGSMEKEKIVENVVAAINGVAETVPRKWKNIRSLHLKFSESLALPVYQAVPQLNVTVSGLVRNDGFMEQKKSLSDGEVDDDKPSVKKQKKNVQKNVAKKGRIHEVRYMDGVDGLLLGGNEEGNGDVLEEEMSGDDGHDDMSGDVISNTGKEETQEFVKPRKRKGKESTEEVVKPLKKKAKETTQEFVKPMKKKGKESQEIVKSVKKEGSKDTKQKKGAAVKGREKAGDAGKAEIGKDKASKVLKKVTSGVKKVKTKKLSS